MPVEIRELVIRAIVSAKQEEDADESENENPSGSTPAENTEAIIQECVRQVLRILRKEKER